MAVDRNGAIDHCKCPRCRGIRATYPDHYDGLRYIEQKPVSKEDAWAYVNKHMPNFSVGTQMTMQMFEGLGYKPKGGWVRDFTRNTVTKVSTLDSYSATPAPSEAEPNKPDASGGSKSRKVAEKALEDMFAQYGKKGQLAKAFAELHEEDFKYNPYSAQQQRYSSNRYLNNYFIDSGSTNSNIPSNTNKRRAERTDNDMNFDDGYEGNGVYTRVNGEWFYSTGNGNYEPLENRGTYNVVLANGGKFNIEVDQVENFDSARTFRYKNENGDRVTLNMAHVQSVTEPKHVNAITQALRAKRETEAYEAAQAARKEEARARKVEQKREELAVEADAKAAAKK